MTRRMRWPLFLLIALLSFFLFFQVNYEVPILMYHRVAAPVEPKGLYVSPETFQRQMEFLKAHNYKVVPLAEIVDALNAGRFIPPNTVAITFDDGYLDNFENAFPVLRKLGFPATIFMITENIGRSGWLGEEDLRILDDSEITIGSHTVSHAFLPKLSEGEIQAELIDSKIRLEEILGHPVRFFSYPAGGSSPEISSWVREAGYEGAVTTNYGKKRHDAFRLHRIKASESHGNLFNFWAKVSGLYHVGKKRVEASAGYED